MIEPGQLRPNHHISYEHGRLVHALTLRYVPRIDAKIFVTRCEAMVSPRDKIVDAPVDCPNCMDPDGELRKQRGYRPPGYVEPPGGHYRDGYGKTQSWSPRGRSR